MANIYVTDTGKAMDNALDLYVNVVTSAPEHARRQYHAKYRILKMSEGLKGAALERWVARWNADHPTETTSVSSVRSIRRAWHRGGPPALLGKRGIKRRGMSKVRDQWYAEFARHAKKEMGLGYRKCWELTLAFAYHQDPMLKVEDFPSLDSFIRRHKQESIAAARTMAKKGKRTYQRSHSPYVQRDYSHLLAGELWVSDHAQIDVGVMVGDQTVFPWVTAWRDVKSGLWMGWDLHAESPNSDHIFISLKRGIERYGSPSDVLLDRGKDYRSKDFSGGARKVRVEVDEMHARNLCADLSIEVHFAQAYNARAKPIERDFRTIKEWFCRGAAGYRGGNVVERPESLKTYQAGGVLDSLDDMSAAFDQFIMEVFALTAVQNKQSYRYGKCPREIWDAEAPLAANMGKLRRLSPDALKLLCCRSSKDYTVKRNGVYDPEYQVWYYNYWMSAFPERVKVFMRRDPRAWQHAYFFRSDTGEYVGSAELTPTAPVLARNDIERAQLKQAVTWKNKVGKMVRGFAKEEDPHPIGETVEGLATARRLLNKAKGYEPTESTLDHAATLATSMDRVLTEERRRERVGQGDLDAVAPPEQDRKQARINPWAAWESDSEGEAAAL